MAHHDSRREAIWKAAEAALIARRRGRILSQSLSVAAVTTLILGAFVPAFQTRDGRLTAATHATQPLSVVTSPPPETGPDVRYELHGVEPLGVEPLGVAPHGSEPGDLRPDEVGLQWAELEWVRSDPKILERCAVPSRPVSATMRIGDEELLALLSVHGRSTGIARVGKQVFVLDASGDIPHF